MATGCKQGDNFGSLFYAVGFQQYLVKIHEAIQRHIKGFVEGCSPVGGVTGFIDDTTIYVDARIADLVIAEVLVIYVDAGIELNLSKCRFLVPPGTILPTNGLLSFPVERTGCIILGCPVGIPSYRRASAMTIVINKASRSLPAITTLHASTALALTRNCVSARIGYLARVSELADNVDAFSTFDDRIDVAIRSIVGVTDDEYSINGYGRVLRSLPSGLGGLGILRFAGLAGETACLLSREKAYEYLEEYQP